MPASIGCVMWIAASSPCISVYTPVYAGHKGNIPLEWMTGWDFFDQNSAWWTFEKIQRIVAPEKPNPDLRDDYRSQIRYIFDLAEEKEFFMMNLLEKRAMKYWKLGETHKAGMQLTEFTNTNIQSNLRIAQSLLNWLEDKE